MKACFSISLTIADHLFEARDFGFRKHFLTESERSGQRLLEAARRVSGSESIYRINRSSRSEDVFCEIQWNPGVAVSDLTISRRLPESF